MRNRLEASVSNCVKCLISKFYSVEGNLNIYGSKLISTSNVFFSKTFLLKIMSYFQLFFLAK